MDRLPVQVLEKLQIGSGMLIFCWGQRVSKDGFDSLDMKFIGVKELFRMLLVVRLEAEVRKDPGVMLGGGNGMVCMAVPDQPRKVLRALIFMVKLDVNPLIFGEACVLKSDCDGAQIQAHSVAVACFHEW